MQSQPQKRTVIDDLMAVFSQADQPVADPAVASHIAWMLEVAEAYRRRVKRCGRTIAWGFGTRRSRRRVLQ